MPPDFTLASALAGAIGLALCLYFLFGGADFGGGVWDLLATGPRAGAQRRAVADAIGPIWEANHVWLVLVVVLLFTGFPRAFAAISVALHVPLTLFLIGVVLRGSAFAFRSAGAHAHRDGDGAGAVTPAHARGRFGLVFSIASTVSPFLLGAIVGALVSGRIRVDVDDGLVRASFFSTWLGAFPLAIGCFALALCAFLAAVYLTVEVRDEALREDFRRRAIAAGIAVGLAAALAFLLAGDGAPLVREALSARPWSWPFHGLTGCAAVLALWGLGTRRYRLARAAAVAQTAFILLGWALAQMPYLVVPDLTLANTAASPRIQRLLLIALGAGVPILVPSLVLLYRVFKRRPSAA